MLHKELNYAINNDTSQTMTEAEYWLNRYKLLAKTAMTMLSRKLREEEDGKTST